ncbi:flagellar hook-associated protein FlgL [Ideonella sp. 4Y11]|uniref:Flagellar hook-associated protein FlgL n=1 Tax=Ideonella aquatica TaxID=2824119 RepID=A0A940YM99_9BURK|nr:flagellar hook-associated protein FlgL [Ideonella aquatica]MBQ0958538.1 flagellar hook-associated protein FlgL [Ideonella aquatica]
MFRVATLNAYEKVINTLQKRQQNLVEAQQQLTSGKRVLHASDDPVAAARAERARALLQRSDANQRAVDASKNSMTLTESALGDAGELLQQARELVVAAGNASYSDAQRQDVAKQLAEIRKQLMSVANRGNGAGGFVFSGQGTSQPPFLDAPGGVAYTGTGGQVEVASDEQLPLTFDGRQVWMGARTGNGVFETRNLGSDSAWIDAGRVTDPAQLTGSTYSVSFSVVGGVTTYSVFQDGNPTALSGQPYTSGQAISIDGMSFAVSGDPADADSFEIVPSSVGLSVFDALDQVVNALKTPNQTATQVTQVVQTGLRDVDQSLGQLQSSRSLAGETLNRIEGVQARVSDLKLFAKTTESDAEDLDETQAISDFANQQTGYQVALQTYATLQKMSLFQYINS